MSSRPDLSRTPAAGAAGLSTSALAGLLSAPLLAIVALQLIPGRALSVAVAVGVLALGGAAAISSMRGFARRLMQAITVLLLLAAVALGLLL